MPVVGLVDAPGQRFVFSLYDAGEIWVADLSNPKRPLVKKFTDIGQQPYDGLITPDGSRSTVGFAETTRGCKYFCRHCPVVPVYQGTFRVIAPEIVLNDIRRQDETA